MIEGEAETMTHPETEETEIWSEEDYAAIDAVAPYEQEKRYYTAEEVLERARKRTQAWLQAAETTLTA
jgi:hypothetical protein